MIEIRNPGSPGEYAFDSIICASAGLNYAAVPALNQFVIYDNPDPAYVTGRINISAFAELGFGTPWPFTNTNVPLNGHIRIPRGAGPFPLVIFAHGNHNPTENSTPGYIYLCELLASHGIIAATIDVNFLNGFNQGENDARAIVHLEHLKQFRAWNGTPGHPLGGKVDLNHMMIVGHSRGGEGVGHASYFNRLSSIQPVAGHPTVPLDGSVGLGPYHFRLAVVAAIAPTDRQYVPVTGPTVVPDNYFLIHGSRDGDVSSFEGYNTYGRAHALDPANPTVSDGKLKALLWVFGANHNQFNSSWPSETGPGFAMPRAEQEQIARVHLGALAAAFLKGRHEYLKILRDHAAASAWEPVGVTFVSQYQDAERVFVEHNQEGVGPPQVSSPVLGTVLTAWVVTSRQFFDLVHSSQPAPTITLRMEWHTLGARFQLDLTPGTLSAGGYNTLAVRAGQSTEAPNVAGVDQDFTLEISDSRRTTAVRASSLHRLLYPDVVGGAGKTVMQSLRLPVERLRDAGVDPGGIRSIALVFDQRSAGVIYLGDVQLCN
jgi:hypothetical protein